jgi:hypothetical protein
VVAPAKAVESPAPVEAIAPVAKPARKPRAPKKVADTPAVAAETKPAAKTAAPRRKRAAKTRPEA